MIIKKLRYVSTVKFQDAFVVKHLYGQKNFVYRDSVIFRGMKGIKDMSDGFEICTKGAYSSIIKVVNIC